MRSTTFDALSYCKRRTSTWEERLQNTFLAQFSSKWVEDVHPKTFIIQGLDGRWIFWQKVDWSRNSLSFELPFKTRTHTHTQDEIWNVSTVNWEKTCDKLRLWQSNFVTVVTRQARFYLQCFQDECLWLIRSFSAQNKYVASSLYSWRSWFTYTRFSSPKRTSSSTSITAWIGCAK